MKSRKSSGFTIIEVVLVLAIAGLIFLVVFMALPQLQKSRRDTQRKSDAGRVVVSLENYSSNHNGSYPVGSTAGFESFLLSYFGAKTVRTPALTAGQYQSSELSDPLNGFFTIAGTTGAYTPAVGFGQGNLVYGLVSQCGPAGMIAGVGRSAAVIIGLEQGSWYCQDNGN